MRARLIALVAAALLLVLPLQPTWAEITDTKESANLNNLDLPSALADDDSFDDLPFEQLRQALRNEVEQNPKKNHIPRSTEQYNLLIR